MLVCFYILVYDMSSEPDSLPPHQSPDKINKVSPVAATILSILAFMAIALQADKKSDSLPLKDSRAYSAKLPDSLLSFPQDSCVWEENMWWGNGYPQVRSPHAIYWGRTPSGAHIIVMENSSTDH